MITKGAEVARSDLLAGEYSHNWWQLQDHAEHCRQGAMTPEQLVVENKVL